MFSSSIKQLIRRPGRAFIFFLLILLITAMLVFSTASVIETNQRLDAVNKQFTTIATVTQHWQPGEEILDVDMLAFEDAEYVNLPETRPLLMTYNSQIYTTSTQNSADSIHLVEFTPLADCSAIDELVDVQIVNVHYDWYDNTKSVFLGSPEKTFSPGDVIKMHQLFEPVVPLEAGKIYIANLSYIEEQTVFAEGYIPNRAPFSTQHSPDGQLLEIGIVRDGGILTDQPRIEEVTKDFWTDGSRGQDWINWVQALEYEKNTSPIPVIPTNSLSLLPTFHSKQAYISSGREITEEEFSQGAEVCLLPYDLMVRNALKVGDKINLPMCYAMYGFVPSGYHLFHFNLDYSFSPLDSQGDFYRPFWEKEYEIVGEYKQIQSGTSELYYDMIILPRNSIRASWENNIAYFEPMNALNTSFEISNGTIAEFNTELHQAVPTSSRLEIRYDDNGYEDVMASLKDAQLSGSLLLSVSIFATIAIIILLCYFFVVKEGKRTAIERSLGMTKRQCRISLLSGIVIIVIPALILGSFASWALTNMELENKMSEMSQAVDKKADTENAFFSREFSLWAENEHNETDIVLDEVPLLVLNSVYFVVPLFIFFTVVSLTVFLININLLIEPIRLLGGRGD